MKLKRGIIALGLLSAVSLQSWAQQLKGVVIDKNSKETLIGAVISIEGTDVKAVTDVNGNFSFDGLKDGTYTLYIKYVGYKTLKIDGVQMKDANLTIALQPVRQQKILCKWEMREVIGNICKTFPYIFMVYYFFLLPLVKS